MKKIFSMAALALVCASCSNDLPEMISGNQQNTPKTNLEYALEYAEDLIGHLDPMTRGSHRHANVQVICNQTTRAGEQDTLLYLVNYDDNMGFALLDAEGKNGGVYAISPKGHLEFSDSINNPALALFFHQVENVSTTSLPTNDSLTIIGWSQGNPLVVSDHANPSLCERYASWSSDGVSGIAPDGGNGTVTTAATVLAKMLAYYMHPDYIDGTAINWKYISGTSMKKATVSLLQKTLNSQSFLEDTPIAGSTATGDLGRAVSPDNVRNALLKLGFVLEDSLLNVNAGTNLFANFQNAKKMKIILGSQQLIPGYRRPRGPVIAFTQPLSNNGHITYPYTQYWIIDGFMDRVISRPGFVPYPGYPTSVPTLYHCVWGLGDYLDGYYAFVAEGYIDNNCGNYETSKIPGTNVNKTSLVFDEMEDQYFFPYPGAIGGFDIQPLTQP